MFKMATLLAALALAVALPASNAFYSGDLSPQMIGGDVVSDITSYSFQVAIRPLRTQGTVTITLPTCSGIIIKGNDGVVGTSADAYYILTSATCALSGTSYQIFIGTNKVDATSKPDLTVLSSVAIITTEYLSTFSEGDLAIIPDSEGVISAAITASSATKLVSTALLPNLKDAGKSYFAYGVSMSGWGYPNDVFEANSPRLRSLKSYVVLNTICKLAHLGKPVTSKHLCTGGLLNKGPCTGDSGAPLVVSSGDTRRVVGLATLTPTNGCSKGKPGVFTNLGYYLSWIVQNTRYDPEQ